MELMNEMNELYDALASRLPHSPKVGDLIKKVSAFTGEGDFLYKNPKDDIAKFVNQHSLLKEVKNTLFSIGHEAHNELAFSIEQGLYNPVMDQEYYLEHKNILDATKLKLEREKEKRYCLPENLPEREDQCIFYRVY